MNESEFRNQDTRREITILRNNHDLMMRRANDQQYGTVADRTQARCEANNIADRYFTLTGKPIEEMV